MKADTWLRASPGGPRSMPRKTGEGVRLTGAQQVTPSGTWVEVRPIDESGKPQLSGSWWIERGTLTLPPAERGFVYGGQAPVSAGVGSAGRAILEGRTCGGYHRCGYTAQDAMPELPRGIGVAANYANPKHRQALVHHGWHEVTSGDWRPDDVVVYAGTDRNPAGHVGFAAFMNGRWGVISNLNGDLGWHRVGAVGGRVTVWRRGR